MLLQTWQLRQVSVVTFHTAQSGPHVRLGGRAQPKQRVKGPTYEAGLSACTQGAAGRVMTGLRGRGGGRGGRKGAKVKLKNKTRITERLEDGAGEGEYMSKRIRKDQA